MHLQKCLTFGVHIILWWIFHRIGDCPFYGGLLFFGKRRFSKKIRKLLKIFLERLGAVVFSKKRKLTKINKKIVYNIISHRGDIRIIL